MHRLRDIDESDVRPGKTADTFRHDASPGAGRDHHQGGLEFADLDDLARIDAVSAERAEHEIGIIRPRMARIEGGFNGWPQHFIL